MCLVTIILCDLSPFGDFERDSIPMSRKASEATTLAKVRPSRGRQKDQSNSTALHTSELYKCVPAFQILAAAFSRLQDPGNHIRLSNERHSRNAAALSLLTWNDFNRVMLVPEK